VKFAKKVNFPHGAIWWRQSALGDRTDKKKMKKEKFSKRFSRPQLDELNACRLFLSEPSAFHPENGPSLWCTVTHITTAQYSVPTGQATYDMGDGVGR
jgi:hypothetical protein